jgi:pimeloyl-[acyl-carrier protein] methyl ester esterase
MTPDHAVPTGGDDVVLLHGWGTHAGVWDELASSLAQEFRVHAVDLPGHGRRPSCTPGRLEALADTLAQEMPRPCHVVGWSLGALVALAWARAAPSQIQRLVLLSATPCFVRRAGWVHGWEPEVLRAFGEQLEHDYGGTIKRFIALQVLGDDDAPRVARQLQRHVLARDDVSVETLQGGLRILLDADLRDELAGIRQPTLVVHGDRDQLIPVAAGHYLGRSIPGARFEVVTGAAHAPFLSKLPVISRLLQEFLDG